MKKIIGIVILIIFIVPILYGCDKFINADKVGIKTCDKIINYLENGDNEGLKKMFCNKTLDNENIDEEIEDAIDFFNGKVKSYDVKILGSGESFRDGKREYLSISPRIENIVTDTNNQYKIEVYYYIVYRDDIDKEGISEITIESETGEKCTIGQYIE